MEKIYTEIDQNAISNPNHIYIYIYIYIYRHRLACITPMIVYWNLAELIKGLITDLTYHESHRGSAAAQTKE